jgi:hypothetical protein
MSTRAFALGGAEVPADRDPTLLFVAPALVERARGSSLSLHRYRSGSRVISLATATSWLGGGAAIGFRSVTYPAPGGGASPPALPGERMRTSRFPSEPGDATPLPVSESALTVGYGRLYRGFRVGGAVSALEVRTRLDSDWTPFLDLGVARDISRITVALSGGGIGPDLDLSPGFRRVPIWLRMGAGTQAAPVGPLDLTGAFSLTLVEGGEVEAGGGLEVGWWPVQGRTFVGRIGLGGTDIPGARAFTLGAAFLGDSLALEYAWRGVRDEVGSHGVSVRFR